MEHMGHNLAESLEKAVEEGAFLAVSDTTGRTEAAFTAERGELHPAAGGVDVPQVLFCPNISHL